MDEQYLKEVGKTADKTESKIARLVLAELIQHDPTNKVEAEAANVLLDETVMRLVAEAIDAMSTEDIKALLILKTRNIVVKNVNKMSLAMNGASDGIDLSTKLDMLKEMLNLKMQEDMRCDDPDCDVCNGDKD